MENDFLRARRRQFLAMLMHRLRGPGQVLAKLQAYAAIGMEAFILSGYPHAAEGDLFARHVMPHLEHGPLIQR